MIGTARALGDDLAQRILTLNKFEQRRNLARILSGLSPAEGSKALDFGCGTGLFTSTLQAAGLDYLGYDIDESTISAASFLHPGARYTSSSDRLAQAGPFDLVLANCCFHHMDETEITRVRDRLAELIRPGGRLVLIDILHPPEKMSPLRKVFLNLERGAYLRTEDEYRRIIENRFRIDRSETVRSHVLSFKSRLNPFFNDLLVLECSPLPRV